MNTVLISAAAIVGYMVAGGVQGYRLWNRIEHNGRHWLFIWGFAAVLLHAAVLVQKFYTFEGLNFGFFNAFSLLGWLIALLLLVTAVSKPLENLAVVILPAAALTLLLEMLFPSHHFLPDGSSPTLQLHILISVIAYSMLSIAALQAIVLAVQDRHLHNNQPGGLIRMLPPLQTMEDLLFQMIALGFVMMSLSLLSGFVYLEDMFAQHVVHKTVLSLISWLFFAVLLWGRWRYGWRGRRALRVTLSGFLSLLLAYFGSKLVLELVKGV